MKISLFIESAFYNNYTYVYRNCDIVNIFDRVFFYLIIGYVEASLIFLRI